MIFDSHAHYDDEAFDKDRDCLLSTLEEQGVGCIVNVGASFQGAKDSVELSMRYPHVYAAVGVHPDHVGELDEVKMQHLREMCTMEKTVAVGEIGLDYYWMEDPKEVQEKVFRRQIAIAREMNIPFSVHTREALEDTYRILKDEKISDIGGIMHSFSGDYEWAKRFLDLGMHISFSGVVTFKKALDVQEAATNVPIERLLVETDAPYLAPVPFRGKRNEPGYTRYTVEKIAELRNLLTEEVAAQTWSNAHRLFGLSEHG